MKKKQASLSCNFNRSYFGIKLIQTGHLTQIHLFSADDCFYYNYHNFFKRKRQTCSVIPAIPQARIHTGFHRFTDIGHNFSQ